MTVKAIGKFAEKSVSINIGLNCNKRARRWEADKRGGDSEKNDSSGKSKQRTPSHEKRN